MRVEDDAIAAEVALKRGWIDPERLRRALELQWAARAAGVEARLLDVLTVKGFLAEREARVLGGQLSLEFLCEPEHNREIAGYMIFRSLGQGGLGAVFKAVQLSMDRSVVMNVLSPDLAKDPDLRERFLREAKAGGRISHPNVVGGLDSGRSKDFHYYTTELVEGQDLSQAVRVGPMPIPKVVDVAAQMVRALIHAAELGLTHRDIQPSSILITADGTARLCGLGAARFPHDPSVTETGIPVGSPLYISPELAAGWKSVDIRSDVYSLGAVLYHLVTGQSPFQAPSVAALLRKHMEEPLRPPRELRPDMPAALSALIWRMMSKSPADRCASLDALLRAFEGISAEGAPSAAALPTIAPPPPAALPSQGAAAPAPAPVPVLSEAAPLPTIAPPSAPPAPEARSLLEAVTWAVIFGTLVALLAAATVWALRARSRRARPRPATVEAGPPEESQVAQPPPVPAQPRATVALPRPEPTLDEPARRLVAAALAFDREQPQAHAEALLQLRRALLAAGGSSEAKPVEERLRARELALQEAAGRASGELTAAVQPLREGDKFGDALRACAAFPPALRIGPWAERLETQFATLGAQAEQRYLELATSGALTLQSPHPADGVGFYDRMATLGIPWITRAGSDLLAAARLYADAEQQRAELAVKRRTALQRRQAFGRLTDRLKTVQDELRNRQYAKALELCEATPEALRQGELGGVVAELGERIKVLAEIWEAIMAGPPAALGKDFELHGHPGTIVGYQGAGEGRSLVVRIVTTSGQSTVTQAIRRLPAAQAARLAEWALSKDPPRDAAVKLGLFWLAEGKEQEARPKLEEAARLGADAAPYIEEAQAAETVAQGLAACQKEEWAKARDLLETALDRYGARLPAIVSHPALSKALARCLAELGQPATPPAAGATPLPATLRRLVLLPTTRLSPVPPANPLDAFLASPLERASPLVLGLSTWRDYTLVLRWTWEGEAPAEPGRFVLLFRLTEPTAGQFAYGYVAVEGDRLAVGRCLAGRREEWAARAVPELLERRPHQLTLTLSGEDATVALDASVALKGKDPRPTPGNIGLATSDSRLLIHELSVLLPPAGARHEGAK